MRVLWKRCYESRFLCMGSSLLRHRGTRHKPTVIRHWYEIMCIKIIVQQCYVMVLHLIYLFTDTQDCIASLRVQTPRFIDITM